MAIAQIIKDAQRLKVFLHEVWKNWAYFGPMYISMYINYQGPGFKSGPASASMCCGFSEPNKHAGFVLSLSLLAYQYAFSNL